MSKETTMTKQRDDRTGDAPVAAEGARRATGAATGGTTAGPLEPGQRWSVARKREVTLRLLRGESLEAPSRELGVEMYRLEALKGNREGHYSIRINDQWRVCFEWPDGSPGAVNVEIVDYH